MKTKLEQRAELNAALNRIETFVKEGNWLGANWAMYPELAIPRGRDCEIGDAIPDWVWDESQWNFRCAASKVEK